jgi:hypothetical protein
VGTPVAELGPGVTDNGAVLIAAPAAVPTSSCSPSTSGRARLTVRKRAPRRAPPAARIASITREPAGNSTIPGSRTLPSTSTTTVVAKVPAEPATDRELAVPPEEPTPETIDGADPEGTPVDSPARWAAVEVRRTGELATGTVSGRARHHVQPPIDTSTRAATTVTATWSVDSRRGATGAEDNAACRPRRWSD